MWRLTAWTSNLFPKTFTSWFNYFPIISTCYWKLLFLIFLPIFWTTFAIHSTVDLTILGSEGNSKRIRRGIEMNSWLFEGCLKRNSIGIQWKFRRESRIIGWIATFFEEVLEIFWNVFERRSKRVRKAFENDLKIIRIRFKNSWRRVENSMRFRLGFYGKFDEDLWREF